MRNGAAAACLYRRRSDGFLIRTLPCSSIDNRGQSNKDLALELRISEEQNTTVVCIDGMAHTEWTARSAILTMKDISGRVVFRHHTLRSRYPLNVPFAQSPNWRRQSQSTRKPANEGTRLVRNKLLQQHDHCPAFSYPDLATSGRKSFRIISRLATNNEAELLACPS